MPQSATLVIGHRGAAGEAPENTIASFVLAEQQGADAMELDIHLSRDGEIVVCHDYTIDRTTNGTGRVDALTFQELQQWDAGSWKGEAYKGERLPLLRDVCQRIGAHIQINVEIKGDSPALREALLREMREHDLFDRLFLSCFNHTCMMELKAEEPRLRVGLLFSEEQLTPAQARERYGDRVYSLHPHFKFIDAAYTAEAKKLGMHVFPWTVNDAEKMRQLIADGVSGIITDYPGVLRSILNESR